MTIDLEKVPAETGTVDLTPVVPRDPNTRLTMIRGNIAFIVGGEERLRVESDGSFYVAGRLAATDAEVYEALREWLGETARLRDEEARRAAHHAGVEAAFLEAERAVRRWAQVNLNVGSEEGGARADLLLQTARSLGELRVARLAALDAPGT